jgi:type I restriction enzyme S subunit
MAREGLSKKILELFEIPLPPLEEQKRIVAKVDQLMALCNELEVRQQKQQQGRVRLNSSALDALLTAREPDEFADHWQRISTNFDLLYDHPETITKLRAAILQLAVQGRLVPQDPNDEPASVLLERIKAEKARLVKEGELKEVKPLEPASVNEVPFEMPDGWAVQRFGDITNTVGGVTKGRKLTGRKTASYPYLRVANVQRWFVNLDVMKEIEIPVEELGKYKLLHGDLLITEGGDWDKVGRTAVWEGQIENCLHQNHIFRSRLFVDDLCRDWLVLTLNSPVGREYFAGSSKQTTNLASINMTQLKHFPIPVPPIIEQKRIVAKVDQLMVLCDEFEAKLDQAQQHSKKLMEATVRQLLGTSTPQKPHTARAPAAPATSKSGRPARHAYQPAPAIAEPIAAETAVVYGGSVPETILAAMRPGQEYSRAAILAATSIREADWMWAIKQLKDQRRVAQTGEKRGARYRLK